MKEFFNRNKVMFSMIIVVIVCTILSAILLLKYFYFGNGGSNYGDRLTDIESLKIEESRMEEIASRLKENDNVNDASIRTQGKIIYINIKFIDGYNLISAQNIAKVTLDEFSEEEKNVYDICFTLKSNPTEKSEGINMMGAHNAHGSNLVWNNNNTSNEEEDE